MGYAKHAALFAAATLLAGAPAAATVAAAPATATPITQFDTGLAGTAEPLSLTAGPEQTVWFGQRGSAGDVDRVSPRGGISLYPTPDGDNVNAVTEGPEGNIWFSETGGGAEVGMIEPLFGVPTEYPLPTNTKVTDLVAGPDGDIWYVGEAGSQPVIGRIAPSTGAVTGEWTPPASGAKLGALTSGPEGDIYFTETNNPALIGRLEPATDQWAESKLPTNAEPTGIATGPEGDIYFTETHAGSIGRIDPRTCSAGSCAFQEFSGITQGKPEQIVAGSDGDMYFTESANLGAIGQLSPAGTITEFKGGTDGLSEKAEPWAIAAGPDGNIWFTEKNNPARVGRLYLPPSVTASSASGVGASSATLNATVATKAQTSSYYFEYGTSGSYGSRTPSGSAGSAGVPVAVAATIGALAPSTTYHFRAVVANTTGTTYGEGATFTTPAEAKAPPITPITPPQLTEAAVAEAAVLGTDAGAAPASGTILVQNAAGILVPLSGPQVLPLGTVIDATKGVVRLTTALPQHRTQAVVVWGGRFLITQSKHGNGLTHIVLTGALPTCARRGAARAAKKGKSPRKLWAEDNHGRYSTYGANSVATVLGTEWETVDSCAGTLTRVLKGKVRVRDLHRKKTVLVKAGHSYLARP